MASSTSEPATTPSTSCRRRRLRLALLAAAALLILFSPDHIAVAQPVHKVSHAAVSKACSSTRHQALCFSTLTHFPGAAAATDPRDLVHVNINMTLQRLSRAFYDASSLMTTALHMDPLSRFAVEDCVELLDASVDHLSSSLAITGTKGSSSSSSEDVLTWLSAAVTNQDTCLEGLQGAPPGEMRDRMMSSVRDLSELVSNCLAVFANTAKNEDFAGVPIENRRRLMGFPEWVRGRDRRLLQLPAGSIQADFIVSKDGNGTHKTISQAVQAAPEYSPRRIVIYIKAGRYDENIKVSRKKTNLMFVGEDKSKTIIAGSRSVFDNYTTFHTATFAATGAGFIARDITFQNWAGPEKHQAVALRVGADHAVVYRCNVIGYQDTLYVHSQRQFFRECDVYGTVDFIFGNAAVVFQNCSLYARKPLPFQKNTITAQNRKDPNQNTGISIHACRVLATPDLYPAKDQSYTYLGRPWKLYSRVVYMMTYIADHVQPVGWLEWNATFALDTLYYGEYMNYGPGAALAKRVAWPGYKVITAPEEAGKFTVGQFITGSSWLPSTGVSFLAGLSL